MNESLSLRDASAQEIQLELLRRTNYNALDGEKVYNSLMKHRQLWLAVLLDQSSLIKLRDLSDNFWNADTLFILTRTRDQSREVACLAEEENWGCDEIHVYENQQEIDRALGSYGQEYGLLSIWWD